MTARISDHVDGQRLWRDLMDLAGFGATDRGGVCRLALSQEEIGARAALVAWGREFGLRASVDPAAQVDPEAVRERLGPLGLATVAQVFSARGAFAAEGLTRMSISSENRLKP